MKKKKTNEINKINWLFPDITLQFCAHSLRAWCTHFPLLIPLAVHNQWLTLTGLFPPPSSFSCATQKADIAVSCGKLKVCIPRTEKAWLTDLLIDFISVSPTYPFCQENWGGIIKDSDRYSSTKINRILCRIIIDTHKQLYETVRAAANYSPRR